VYVGKIKFIAIHIHDVRIYIGVYKSSLNGAKQCNSAELPHVWVAFARELYSEDKVLVRTTWILVDWAVVAVAIVAGLLLIDCCHVENR